MDLDHVVLGPQLGRREALDGEWAEDGIRVRSLMPSYIDTPLLDAPPNERSKAIMRDVVRKMGREIGPASAKM